MNMSYSNIILIYTLTLGISFTTVEQILQIILLIAGVLLTTTKLIIEVRKLINKKSE